MIFLALYYLAALIVVLALCAALYVSLGRYGRVKYVAIPVFFIGSMLLIPMPIHGGFMIFGEVVFDGIEEFLEDRHEVVREQLQTDWHESFKERLPEAVSIAKEIPVNPYWNRVILTDQTEAWLDIQEGLVWRDVMLRGGSNEGKANLIKACGQAGSFTLALEIELFYFYKNRGPEVMPFAEFRYPSLLIDDQFQLELVKWRNFLSRGNQQQPSRDIAIRCVGRTRRVPAEGLVNRQISALEWNRFQMAPIR